MSRTHNFEHLPLFLRYQGKALLRGGGEPSPQTLANKGALRQSHSSTLDASAHSFSTNWQARKAQRQASAQPLPDIPAGIPILLKVDTSLDLDVLRKKFKFEIVAEQEEGYVIVASEDIQLTQFRAMAQGFATTVRGSATIAQVYTLFDDPNQRDRLERILSERLMVSWGNIDDGQSYIVDIGIACTGTEQVPPRPKRGVRTTDAQWEAKQREWSDKRNHAYDAWDEIKMERESSVQRFAEFYQAEIIHLTDGADFEAGVLPDSFTVRLKISGKGLKDFVLNYPFIFEVVEPEDIALPQLYGQSATEVSPSVVPIAPDADAPAVCVIDSGIQEGHILLQPSIDRATSYCFLPNENTTAVADEVAPGGHGTRVAGAVLYGENIPTEGAPKLPFWIQNARVLNANNGMPVQLFPPAVLRKAVEQFNDSPRQTRIFNHSINARGYCRTLYMSSWAAEIDQLCNERDVLIVQSAGNLALQGPSPLLGISDHLNAGRDYPVYLGANSARVANPAQSLQALTVGSIAYDAIQHGAWRTFATHPSAPSAFSRTGPGIWNVIKPEIVEYGGDAVRTNNTPANIQAGGVIPAACPNLVRSTLHSPGPAADRDTVGTSYAAPKVARIAAQLQRTLPSESALLYRALIVQSAQWPNWAEDILSRLRSPQLNITWAEKQELFAASTNAFRCLGFGVPDETRATTNTDHRTTIITNGEARIHAGECHIYQVPIPPQLRQQADEFDVRIDVTMSYVAQPRRTRRNLRRYLSTWVDWKASKLGEGLHDFRVRAMKDATNTEAPLSGSTLPWVLHEKPQDGLIRDFKRNSGTVQKDWAVVKSNSLPDHFCIAVVGHQGWSQDPDSTARYVLAITFEVLGGEITIYEPLRAAISELQAQAEAEIEADEIELEIEAAE